MAKRHPGTFKIRCCNHRRMVAPGGVVVCTHCDCAYTITDRPPEENRFRGIPPGVDRWVIRVE